MLALSRTLRAGFAGAAAAPAASLTAAARGALPVGGSGRRDGAVRSNKGMPAGGSCGGSLRRLVVGVEQGLPFEQGTSHRQQAVGDRAQGAAVAMATSAQRGIAIAARRVVLGSHARPMIERIIQPLVAGVAAHHDAALTAASGHRCDPGQQAQGMVISSLQRLPGLVGLQPTDTNRTLRNPPSLITTHGVAWTPPCLRMDSRSSGLAGASTWEFSVAARPRQCSHRGGVPTAAASCGFCGGGIRPRRTSYRGGGHRYRGGIVAWRHLETAAASCGFCGGGIRPRRTPYCGGGTSCRGGHRYSGGILRPRWRPASFAAAASDRGGHRTAADIVPRRRTSYRGRHRYRGDILPWRRPPAVSRLPCGGGNRPLCRRHPSTATCGVRGVSLVRRAQYPRMAADSRSVRFRRLPPAACVNVDEHRAVRCVV